MSNPAELKYTKSHEWIRLSEGAAEIGLTDFAQQELGDIVFVNLPAVGDGVTAGETFADVESVKAVSDVYSPATGTVSAVNEALADAPQLINDSPYEAWLIKIDGINGTDELMSADEYEKFTADGGK